MPTVTVYACSGAFCSKDGNPIYNAVFQYITYTPKAVYHNLNVLPSSSGLYNFGLPYAACDVNVSAPGHGNSTENMSQGGSYDVRL